MYRLKGASAERTEQEEQDSEECTGLSHLPPLSFATPSHPPSRTPSISLSLLATLVIPSLLRHPPRSPPYKKSSPSSLSLSTVDQPSQLRLASFPRHSFASSLRPSPCLDNNMQDESSEAWRGPFNPSTDSLQFASAPPPSNTLGGLMTTLDIIKARTVTRSSNHAHLFYDHSAVADWKTAAYHALLTPWTAASDNRRLACAHGLEALATQWSRNREAGQGPFAASILPSLRDMCLFLERESPRNSPRLNSPLPQHHHASVAPPPPKTLEPPWGGPSGPPLGAPFQFRSLARCPRAEIGHRSALLHGINKRDWEAHWARASSERF
ncbi:hypothetical protein DMC30DRAFT_46903 [Rhodotorula diobovata]|uniref:Uncharacterized protein n=1 Tax=Rhodotorula diobovata TaxID=5288 RepID=A0A5C5FP67_9BASI|nr:hypothetical protein DMC30DRAFT_46903 [Rhodotorula diobovata]